MARRLFCLALFALSLVAPGLSARDFNIADGQVLQIDSTTSRLLLRTGQGSLQCAFDANTRVVGAADRIDELTALSHVTVQYSTDHMQPLASLIEVHPGF